MIKMYAIVEISGKQFKVEKKQKLFVNRLDVAEGKKISFDNVLMLNDGSKPTVGTPNLSGVQVEAKILKHFKSDKVIVFKKKRRKGYKVRNGHRQSITEIEISDILTGVSKKTTAKKLESSKNAESKKTEAPKKAERKKISAKKESQDLSSMTVAALKTMAKEKGITGISSMKKVDLIKALS